MENNNEKKQDPQLISYLTLRKAVGILGVAFSVVLVIGSVVCGGCEEIQGSISSYYHTNMRNIFVGILCAIALFLFAYKGYDNRDAVAGNLACLFALGVAFFPTSVTDSLTRCIPNPIENHIISVIHFTSAAGFFLVLAYFSIFLFTINKGEITKMKLKRNRLYKICGYVMLASILLIAVYSICLNLGRCEGLIKFDPVFWLETIALWAFGVSWLTKGNTLLTDKKA
ncbi:MAG: hypothetical protein JXJ22_13590 [Bacteroidales bacterium]|nr:hypothetical protein [Bacteroidales bacterium]